VDIIEKFKTGLADNFHAFLFVGSSQMSDKLAEILISHYGIEKMDIFRLESDDPEDDKTQIKAEAAKIFVQKMSQSAFGPAKIGIIPQTDQLNPASGNVLLKMLEEPPADTYFFISAKTLAILPTIVSRCRLISENTSIGDGSDLVEYFQKDFYQFSLQADILAKDGRSKELMLQITRHFEKKMLLSKSEKYADALREIFAATEKLSTNANQRLILENVYLKIRDLV